MSVYAETLGVGAHVSYSTPPNVEPAVGQLPFCAPGITGMVVGHEDGHALVRFAFKSPIYSRPMMSEPLKVYKAQPCEVIDVDK